MLDLHRQLAPETPLALNIKADGLESLLTAALRKYRVEDYFVFDMSVPDMVGYAAGGVRFFMRHSDLEPQPALYEHADGVWLDAFYSDWIDENTVARHREHGKRVCLVSPELHGRDHLPFWTKLRSMSGVASSDLLICTDHPEQGRSTSMARIQGVIFDMDGVLIDAKEWHYEALNKALGLFGFQVSRYDHLSTFDGLPTRHKLEMLSLERGLPKGLHSFINELKQQYTLETVYTRCKPTFAHQYLAVFCEPWVRFFHEGRSCLILNTPKVALVESSF